MEPDIEPTDEQIAGEPLLQLFKYKHLRDETMRALSLRFCELALALVDSAPRNPERSTAIRKLREAKDCAVTALLWKDPTRAPVTMPVPGDGIPRQPA